VEAIPELHDQIDRSLREHRHLDELTRAIAALGDGEALNDRMLELQDALGQHVREEERSVFPAVLRAMSKQGLRELDSSLRATKDKLVASSKAESPADAQENNRRTP